MNRDTMIQRLEANRGTVWDVLVIGGGATGLGIAVDAASRGFATVLVEQSDFAKGTSSRSTKLVHGGVRYLQRGEVRLVYEALHERGRLRANAPHLVQRLPILLPAYAWGERFFYGTGLRVYDLLAGRQGFGRSESISRDEALERAPALRANGLRGGVLYYDGQFDDARLAVALAQTAADQGAIVLNYTKVANLIKSEGLVLGAVTQDLETGTTYDIHAKAVVNATGVFADSIRRMDNPDAGTLVQPSQGIHIVLDKPFLPGDTGILVPKTDDKRVLFALPWHDHVLLGTTDTPIDEPGLEPRALESEIDYLLDYGARYFNKAPSRSDVRSVFAGLRPLVRAGDTSDTKALSRDHAIRIAPSGLMTVAGGKWTTYRLMAEDAVDQAIKRAGLDNRPCVTRELRLHGYLKNPGDGVLSQYGSDAGELRDLIQSWPHLGEPIHPDAPVLRGEVVWSVRHEMARTVEDFLARRSRMLVLDARRSIAMAPAVAELMGEELGGDEAWRTQQTAAFQELAREYLPPK